MSSPKQSVSHYKVSRSWLLRLLQSQPLSRFERMLNYRPDSTFRRSTCRRRVLSEALRRFARRQAHNSPHTLVWRRTTPTSSVVEAATGRLGPNSRFRCSMAGCVERANRKPPLSWQRLPQRRNRLYAKPTIQFVPFRRRSKISSGGMRPLIRPSRRTQRRSRPPAIVTPPDLFRFPRCSTENLISPPPSLPGCAPFTNSPLQTRISSSRRERSLFRKRD